jgi:hypothetical protein
MKAQQRRLSLFEGVEDLGYIQKQDAAISSYEAAPKY